jgi:hypothetical protein
MQHEHKLRIVRDARFADVTPAVEAARPYLADIGLVLTLARRDLPLPCSAHNRTADVPCSVSAYCRNPEVAPSERAGRFVTPRELLKRRVAGLPEA